MGEASRGEADYALLVFAPCDLAAAGIEKMLWFLHSYPSCKAATAYWEHEREMLYRYKEQPARIIQKAIFLREPAACMVSAATLRKWLAAGGLSELTHASLLERFSDDDFVGVICESFFSISGNTAGVAEKMSTMLVAEVERQRTKEVEYPLTKDFLPWESYATVGLDTLFISGRKSAAPTLLMILPLMRMGGADKFSLDVVRELCGRGWRCVIVTTMLSVNEWEHEFLAFAQEVYHLPNFLRGENYARFFRSIVEGVSPEIVFISDSYIGHQFMPLFSVMFPSLPVVSLSHNLNPAWRNGGYPRLVAALHGAFDMSLATSEDLRGWMVKRGTPQGRSGVLYTNIDASKWQTSSYLRRKLRTEYGIAKNTCVILYAGRMEPQKRPDVIMGIIDKMASLGAKDYIFLMAGKGPYLETAVAYSEKKGFVKVCRFLGAVPLEKMKALFAMSDIFLLPSAWEGVSLALFEAMACGVVPVVSDVGGQRELVVPGTGFLIPLACADEIETYSRILADLIAHPEKRRTLGSAARKRVEGEFSLNQMVERLLGYFKEAAAHRKARMGNLPFDAAFALEFATTALEFEFEHRTLNRCMPLAMFTSQLHEKNQHLAQELEKHRVLVEKLRRK